MRANINRAELKATELLSSLSINNIPVTLDKIYNHLGISISYDLGDNVSGILVSKRGGSTVIGVNPNESNVRQRFTIAHEIGHYILHKNKSELFVDEDYIVLKRSGEKDPYELEANVFAAALLMPEHLLEYHLKTLPLGNNTEDKIKILAKKFEVSSIAMTYRLTNLRLI